MALEVLIATNGSNASWPAVEYGAWLASTLESSVVLLGAVEHAPRAALDEQHPLEPFFKRAASVFQSRGLPYTLEVETGSADVIIPRRLKGQDCVTVLGPLGRPRLTRLLKGRSIGHMMTDIHGPIVYVPEARIPMKKLLIALGGLGYEWTAEYLALRIALSAGAEISLLHVAPPVDRDYPTARIERKEWRHLDDTNTPIGRSIRQALDLAAKSGLKARVVARQGLAVEEILSEVKSGGYDMLCMGSPHSATPLHQLYTPNVTAAVAEKVTCPLLTARFKSSEERSQPGREL